MKDLVVRAFEKDNNRVSYVGNVTDGRCGILKFTCSPKKSTENLEVQFVCLIVSSS